MSANSIGHIFKFHSFGESHGSAMGVVIEGCPAGLTVSMKVLERELDRRRPGRCHGHLPEKNRIKPKFYLVFLKEKLWARP